MGRMRVHRWLKPASILVGGPSWTRTTDLTLIRGALSPPELRAHSAARKSRGQYIGLRDSRSRTLLTTGRRVCHALLGGLVHLFGRQQHGRLEFERTRRVDDQRNHGRADI